MFKVLSPYNNTIPGYNTMQCNTYNIIHHPSSPRSPVAGIPKKENEASSSLFVGAQHDLFVPTVGCRGTENIESSRGFCDREFC
jgi:hypothetical protein